jgi:hypothetical protein
MYRIVIQDNKVVSLESMHHLPSIEGVEGIFLSDEQVETQTLPCAFDKDGQSITRIYQYLTVEADKKQLLADGTDTATITATVNDATSTETIELYNGDSLVESKPAVNGVATFEITMTEPGTLTLTVKSTTKYGKADVTIEGI